MTLAFWSTVALLLAGALLLVLPPQLRPPRTTPGRQSPLAVYREQWASFDADLAEGLLTPAQHAQVLLELEGRVIDEVGETPHRTAAAPTRRMVVAPVLAVSLLLPAGTLALYGLLGKPAALAPIAQPVARGGDAPHTMSREQMEEMIERLAEKVKTTPKDVNGWHLLARSFVAVGRLPEAAEAYDHASQLAPRDAQMLADYADTLAMLNGRSLEGRPMELVAAALKIDPAHPKALALAGTAAFNRGDFGAAVAAWQKAQAQLPADSEQARSIAASIEQAQAAAAEVSQPTVAGTGRRVEAVAPGGPAAIEGTVTLSAALRSRLAPGATLFVFARAVDGPRMPLAIVRVPAGAFPYRFKLDDSLAMTPQSRLSTQREVVLGARISRSGNATPQSGDFTGTLGPVKLGSSEVRLVISDVVP